MDLQLTTKDFDNFLKKEKGWKRFTSGYEYVYDYKIPRLPIIIKVLSSVPVSNSPNRNRGSEVIRVFAVACDSKDRIIRGLVKNKTVFKTVNWKKDLKDAYWTVRNRACFIVKERGLI